MKAPDLKASVRPTEAARTVLVTGAGGFLGSHLCQQFLSAGYRTWACGRLLSTHFAQGVLAGMEGLVEIDLPSPRFSRVVSDIRPELVVHCASSASVPHSMTDPLSDLRQSTGIYGEVLEAVRTGSPGTTVALLSSAAVYGQPRNLPTSEEEPPRPMSPYGFHKWMCEVLSQEYSDVYGVRTLNLRIFSAYGERLYKQVVFDILSRLSAAGDSPLELHGTGEETRDFLHAVDIARATRLLHESGLSGTFNVASGESTTIRELAETLNARSARPREIRFKGVGRPGDPDRWRADISRLRSTGFGPSISLTEGLARTSDWFDGFRKASA